MRSLVRGCGPHRRRTDWLSFSNQFDLLVTLLLAITSILWLAPAIPIPTDALRYFNLLRLFSLFALFSHSPQFEFVATSFVRISVGCLPVVSLLFCTSAAWAILGCQLWGGYVYAGNPALQDTDYFADNYDVLNFNDLAMSFGIFLPMLVSGGPLTDVIDAFATQSGAFFSIFYFMLYFYVVFLFFFNIFVSIVIDSFCARMELRKSDALDDNNTKELASLFESFQDLEFDLIPKAGNRGSEELFKRMFADEIEEMMNEVFGEDEQADVAAQSQP